MIKYPRLKPLPSSRQTVDAFKGYNHNLRIGAGEFYEMENMTSEDYPVLSVRGRRGMVGQLRNPAYCTGGIYVPGTGLFFSCNEQNRQDEEEGEHGSLYLLTVDGVIKDVHPRLLPGRKSFALMGKTVVIAPDMVRCHIDTQEIWPIRESWEIAQGTVEVKFCDDNGVVYDIHPANFRTTSIGSPTDGTLWMDISGSPTLKQYDAALGQWVGVDDVYIKLIGLGDHNFQQNDSVEISGFYKEGNPWVGKLNGNHTIVYSGHGDLVIDGTLNCYYGQDCSGAPVTIQRKVPDLDFIVESGNRLWGCSNDTNELYACKLGDCRNWNSFQGLSTDSWVGSVGTPGVFTGAIVQSGYPIFYKENGKHKVWPSATGAHQITFNQCSGVEKGSEAGLAVLGGTVFYKSATGICADDGSGPVEISRCLGSETFHNACGVVHDGKYYIEMFDSQEKGHLFVYDIGKKLWHKEQGAFSGCIASGGGSLYIAAGGELLDLTGKTGYLEGPVSWMVQTGDLGLESPDQKYISRLSLRLMLEPGANLEIYAQYDREPVWVKLGQIYGTDLRSFSLPVRPRRCDQLRLKLQGKGMCKIYSITKTMVKGSELS